MKFTPVDITKNSLLIFKSEPIDLSTLQPNGLKSNETIKDFKLTADGHVYNEYSTFESQNSNSGTCYVDNTCVSTLSCSDKDKCNKYYSFKTNNGFTNVNIPIRVIDSEKNKAVYKGVPLINESTYNFEGTMYESKNLSNNNSTVSLKMPIPIHNELDLNLLLKHPNNDYLTYRKHIIIPSTASDSSINSEALLITKSGEGCQGAVNESQCFASQKSLILPLKVKRFLSLIFRIHIFLCFCTAYGCIY